MKKDTILQSLQYEKIVILGFGKEGVSSYRFIRNHFPTLPLTVADKNSNLQIAEFSQDKNVTFVLGDEYDKNLNDFSLILKTPGVNLNGLSYFIPSYKISSQTDLFLKAFKEQVIGITGTKGKSTTASLIYHIFKETKNNVILSGNIGIPFFDIVDSIDDDTTIVAELSAHQLEFVNHSPHIAVLLNLYQEHLDHFNTFSNYQIAKTNITKFQNENDILIYNFDDAYISKLLKAHDYKRIFLPFSREQNLADGACSYNNTIVITKQKNIIAEFDLSHFENLPGRHNFYNMMAAILPCILKNLSANEILAQLKTFKGLPHRLEFVGNFQDVYFYNDSISTIPEATIAALKTLRKVDTLILGGFDRGIDYSRLIEYLQEDKVANIAFTGPAGKRIYTEWKEKYLLPPHFILENDFAEIVNFAFQYTQKGKICLLSPAAASFDQFKDFIERGNYYKKLIYRQKE
ncbi:MAG TPA: UDP-N-acetylmuramoyl-L-alanine--D-glutamate ligase [Bacteroidales bacterium]|nr:UDP-N-acetylmuramoyl-L-alanine--D-glutamate ligase [Bacteroidales bacterium]